MSLKIILVQVTKKWVSALQESFKGHPVANLVRQDFVEQIKNAIGPDHSKYSIKASAGSGTWANVPWLSILDPRITKTTQSGVYPVYLFRADGTGLYLSLGFGTTELKRKYGAPQAKLEAAKLKNKIREQEPKLSGWDAVIDLKSDTALGKSYEWATAGSRFYPAEAIPDDEELKRDLKEILNIYKGLHVEVDEVLNVGSEMVQTSILSKPLILLAGISGTGKSRFVRQQAAAQGNEKEFLQIVPVRPDWHEPSDLLGYVSRISGTPKFIVTDALRFMVKAWLAVGAEVVIKTDGRTGWTGNPLDDINTYWLCLDEMNLAPVEQYFADYLSVIESRSWFYDNEAEGHDYIYYCDPILPASHLQIVADKNSLAQELGLDIVDSPSDKQLWDAFLQHGIPVPFNLVVAGTVNMDETTHGFSRKVIDRALTFDFGRFFPNDFNQLWVAETKPKTLCFSRLSHASKDALASCIDLDGQKTINFLQAVNQVLQDTPFELAYRALNELLLAVISHNPKKIEELQAVWDDFLMCKVLPRIEGDDEKLASSAGASNTAQTLLDDLVTLLSALLDKIWDQPRPDLLRENISGATLLTVPCRSKVKLEWMKNRLDRNSFTSFWP